MILCAVYVYVLLIVAVLLVPASSSCNDCSCVGFVPLGKTLVCDTECSAEDALTEWNIYRKDTSKTINITFTFINGSSGFVNHLNVDNQEFITNQMRVNSARELVIDRISLDVHEADYTCETFFQNRTQCGETYAFGLLVITLFRTLLITPTLLYDTGTAFYGTRTILCRDGDSPGINVQGTSWAKAGVTDEIAIDIMSECPSCRTCADESKFLSLPSVRERLENNYEYSVFVIAVRFIESGGKDFSDCMNITNLYISFLVINEVTTEDNGDWIVKVTSRENLSQTAAFKLTASYKIVDTVIEPLEASKEVSPLENAYIVCNATHSISPDVNLYWDQLGDDSKVSVLSITDTTVLEAAVSRDNFTLEDVHIPPSEINRLCSRYGYLIDTSTVAVSLDYAPRDMLYFNSESEDNALVQRRYLVLLLCNVGHSQAGVYSCISPIGSGLRQEQSMVVKIRNVDTTTAAGVETGAIAGVVVAALVLIAVMVGLVICGIRRYRLLKYEALHMRPMTIPLPLAQLATAVNHTFANMSPIGSPMYNKFEFPRENLVLLEVIGEGQFGQVWRARAIGICSEDSRNIVAVKTLKENFRDSDYYDLRSELDIMRSMEPHPNIINLLGVCSELGSSPLCILMEYAAYGSMKDYLAYCRRVMQAHAEGIASPTLEEAYPSAAASNGAIIRQSMLMGDYPQLQAVGGPAEGNDYHYDPMVASRTRRLIQMLKLQGYQPEEEQLMTEEGATYNHLGPAAAGGAEATGVSLYDRLYPQSQCVYRPCLEAYDYACYRGAQHPGRAENVEQEYYNSLAGGEEATATDTPAAAAAAVSPDKLSSPPAPPFSPGETADTVKLLESSSSPTPQLKITASATTPSVPSASPVRQKTRVGAALSLPYTSNQEPCHDPTSLSTSQDNVFECHEEKHGSTNLLEPTKEHMRESMISFPDGYIYAPAESHLGEMMGGATGEGEMVQRKEKEPAPPMPEDMITNLDLLDFALQIARGMDHLQRMQCVHRDLAARNILIAEDFTLKIGDFGLARDLSDKDYYRKITPGRLPARWMAPESLVERTHTFLSDVWSYGVVMWEILSYGEVPYRGQPEANDCDHLAYYLRSGNRLPPPPNTTDEFRDLMSACWALNPDKRPSFSEIMRILDNQLSAAHGYLSMACAPVDRERLSQHDPTGSANPSPHMQKRKAMLQRLDKLHGADRPVSLQPGGFSKSKLAKSPSLPIAEPLTGTLEPPPPAPTSNGGMSPYLLPAPTANGGGPRLLALRPGSPVKFGSNPELSLSLSSPGKRGEKLAAEEVVGGGKTVNGMRANGEVPTLKGIETQL